MKSIGVLIARPYSPNALIVMVAVFVALFANTALFRNAFALYNGSAEEILFAASLLPFIAAIFAGTGERSASAHLRMSHPA